MKNVHYELKTAILFSNLSSRKDLLTLLLYVNDMTLYCGKARPALPAGRFENFNTLAQFNTRIISLLGRILFSRQNSKRTRDISRL